MRFALLLLLVTLVVAAEPVESANKLDRRFYSVDQIDPPTGFSGCVAVALNERSQVLCEATSDSAAEGFLWDHGTVTVITSPTGGSTWVHALDDSRRVAGADVSPTGEVAPFLWTDGEFTWLQVPPRFVGAEAWAMSNEGTIAGELIDADGKRHGCLWREGEVSLLPTLPGRPYSQVRGINDQGQIVGTSLAVFDPAEGHPQLGRAVLWQGNEAIDLGTLPGYSFSEAHAINNLGTVVGVSYEPPSFRRGVVWATGALQPLEPEDVPSAVDDSGRITGNFPYDRAFELRQGRREWLDRITPRVYDRYLSDAPGLNELGQIAASGSVYWRQQRAFLLSPVLGDIETAITLSTNDVRVGVPFTATLSVTNRGTGPIYHPRAWYSAWDGVRVVGATAPGWELYHGPLYASISTDILQPGETGFLVLQLKCTAAGRIAIKGTCWADNDDASTTVYVDVPGVPLPDLEVWSTHPKYRARSGSRPEWREVDLSVELSVVNRGTAAVSGCVVRFYIVEDTGTYERLILVGGHRFHKLAPGEEAERHLTRRVRLRQLEDLDLEVVVDPENAIRESDETNNTDRSYLDDDTYGRAREQAARSDPGSRIHWSPEK